MNLEKETKIYRTFLVSVSLTIALCLSAVFLGFSIRTKHLIFDEILANARAHFNDIVMMRKWNARHGGVFVEKKNGIVSNPYLENPDIKTVEGKIYTKKNPALMTREISEYFKKEDRFSFHITSLKLMNPNNRPDEFEIEALKQFEGGLKEQYTTERVNNRTYFRYMAPLYIEQACLQCHRRQEYAVGDVRGGISVSMDVEELQGKLKFNALIIGLFALTTLVLLFSLIWYFTARLIRSISEARRKIEHMAVTDELTELFNRRQLMSRFREEFSRAARLHLNLGCIIFDIDNFKKINDTYGHQSGDAVLKIIAARTKESIRNYDVLGRYGGEEFLLILPHTTNEDLLQIAERTRQLIADKQIEAISVTISLGVSYLQDGDQSIESLIKRADEGLYEAKRLGRNRVVAV
ncbi:MAG: diguanylate cyclase [Nitrospirae bacterium]|nr:diguanylate cyclase [Nitrospirota bacterium]